MKYQIALALITLSLSLNKLDYSDIFNFQTLSPTELSNESEKSGISQILQANESKIKEQLLKSNSDSSSSFPVVMMHGMGDFAENPMGMRPMIKAIGKVLNTQAVNAKLAKSIPADMLGSFIQPMDAEVDNFKKFVDSDEKLKNGFNAIGWSQGNLTIRGQIEKQNNPPVKNWISIHGPMLGVSGIPHCNQGSFICKMIDNGLGVAAQTPIIQNHLAQSNQQRDPKRIEAYKKGCHFLPEMNNEIDVGSDSGKNESYKNNFVSLDSQLFIKAEQDTMVIPNESEHFGFWKDGDEKTMEVMKDRDSYKNDDFGLKTIVENGKAKFMSTPGDHMQIPEHQLLDLCKQQFA